MGVPRSRKSVMQKDSRICYSFTILQVLYWAVNALVYTYIGVFLLNKGFTNHIIGIVLLISCGGALFLQSIEGAWLDKVKAIQRYQLIVGSAALVFLVSLFLLKNNSTDWVTLLEVVVLLALVQTMEPLINGAGIHLVEQKLPLNYGVARACSSTSFAVMSVAFGAIINTSGVRVIKPGIVVSAAVLLISAVDFGIRHNSERYKTPANERVRNSKSGSFSDLFCKYSRFCIFIAGMAIVYIPHRVMMNYMYQIMRNVGGGSASQGIAIAIASASEIPTMLLFPRIIKKAGPAKLLWISNLVFTCKIIMVAIAQSEWLIYIAALLQMGSYALYTLASIYYVQEFLPEEHQAKGHALIILPAIIGSMVGGYIGGAGIDYLGVKNALMLLSVISVLGSIVAVRAMAGRLTVKKQDADIQEAYSRRSFERND